jgi:hypothetical protein
MAEYNINNNENPLGIENNLTTVSSKTITKTFGRPEDYIELHIYNTSNQRIFSEISFKDYILPSSLSSTISFDPEQILLDRGYTSGQYTIKLNILRNKLFNTDQLPFTIKEISSDKREIKSIATSITNETLDPTVSSLISEIESSAYFKELSINLDNDIIIPIINVLLNKDPLKHELLLKTLNPLPSSIRINLPFKLVEEIVNPISVDVDLGDPQLVDDSTELMGPNFTIDIRQNNSVPSGFKNYDELLTYSFTSSYQHLLSKLEDGGADLNIQYDYIRPISESTDETTYHFENFTHFSSATERLKNFNYKIKLIELYDSQISNIDSIEGSTSASIFTIDNKNNINKKKENLIKGFDGYEQFLYFESGAFSWPKSNTENPFNLYSVTSSQVTTWLGNENSAFSNYGGQLLSASLYDKQNEYNLNKLIPTHIVDNDDNSLYINFVNMMGQHFDQTWTYIKHLTEVNNSNNNTGISKDLVYFQLKSLGIDTFDQFENSNLTEYILGEGQPRNTVGLIEIGDYIIGGNNQNFYNTNGHETLVTASNEGSIPKQDITKEIWKRLYHNAPYLLKTKGTERGIKALMNCYGIPSTVLNIKEYGGSTPVSGPLKDLDTADTYKTFTYEKSGLALKGDSGTSTGYFIKTNFSSSLTDALSASTKTIEFRIKPKRSTTDYHLFSLSGSRDDLDPHLILTPYTGSSDISSSGDSNQYGKIDLFIGGDISGSTINFPVFNGEFWNIFIGLSGTSGSASNIEFGAYQANFNKNILFYTASVPQLEAERQLTFGDPYYGGNNIGGALEVYFGGVPSNTSANYNPIDGLRYSGSLQEIKYHFGELLNHSTLKKHALEPFMYAGNALTSSFNNVVLRLPLGSNDKQDSSSFHPNIDVAYLDSSIASNLSTPEWEEVVENHYLPTPDTVGASMTSEKVRIDEGTIDDNSLVVDRKLETSTLDRQPQDFEDLGIFFSPTNELNEDIIYTLGSFRLDDYIGSPLPSAQTASKYEDLKEIKDFYFKKVKGNRYRYGDYIKQIQYFDHTLFKIIEQFVPFKANLKTGLLIEPHFLERNKFQRELPSRNDGQTMVTGSHQTLEVEFKKDYNSGSLYSLSDSSFISANTISTTTSSRGDRKETGTNGTIEIYDDHLNPFNKDPNAENNQSHQGPLIPNSTGSGVVRRKRSNNFLGTALKGKTSNRYYKYAEYPIVSSSLY